MKGKPLLPTLRTKKRYVVYECVSDNEIKHIEVIRAIKDSYKQNYGIFGLSEAGIMDTKIYSENRGVLKVNNKYLNKLKTSMAMITKINDQNVILHTVGVSGILKKAKNIVR